MTWRVPPRMLAKDKVERHTLTSIDWLYFAVIIEFSKEAILPNADDNEKPFCWFRAGIYELEKQWHNGEFWFLIPDTSFGGTLDYFRRVDGFGGVRIIKEEI